MDNTGGLQFQLMLAQCSEYLLRIHNAIVHQNIALFNPVINFW